MPRNTIEVVSRTERRRGCGFRRAGGLYLVGDVIVERLPEGAELHPSIPLDEPTGTVAVNWMPFCTAAPFTRSPQVLEGEAVKAFFKTAHREGLHPMSAAGKVLAAHERAARLGLIWVGASHYTIDSFLTEARSMGVSRRTPTLPTTLRPGDNIALAYLHGITATGAPPVSGHCEHCNNVPQAVALANAFTRIGSSFVPTDHKPARRGGDTCRRCGLPVAEGSCERARTKLPTHSVNFIASAFALFVMRGVELILPRAVANDEEILNKCAERGVRVVAVGDNDPAHVTPGWRLPQFLRPRGVDAPTDATDAADESDAPSPQLGLGLVEVA